MATCKSFLDFCISRNYRSICLSDAISVIGWRKWREIDNMTDYKNDTHTIFVPDEYFKPSYNRMFEGFKSFEDLTDKEKLQIVNTLDKFRRIAAERLREKG